ncbi:MAG: hypothetical protein JSR62_04245 [Nitrospira sp.]|nr:hypothetical protein [Nitrospira sp.]
MRQLITAVGMGCLLVLLQGCAVPQKPVGHDTVTLGNQQPSSLSHEEFVNKVERHMDRQDRPGSTLMFR